MRLTFLGTRGNTEVCSRRHRRHSALLVAAPGGARVMIDCGADWLGRIEKLAPAAIVLTHAHPDHALGLRAGAPCPVYATAATWPVLADYPLPDRRVVAPRTPLAVCGLMFEAFPVDHSLRAPAVGYRVTAGGAALFYVPDVVAIHDRAAALAGLALFVGDGATIARPMVRRRGDAPFGHTTIRAQLGWSQEEGVRRAVFTHCGAEIVAGDARRVAARVRALGREHGVAARLAYDGLRLALGGDGEDNGVDQPGR